jgi:hypothetical protein
MIHCERRSRATARDDTSRADGTEQQLQRKPRHEGLWRIVVTFSRTFEQLQGNASTPPACVCIRTACSLAHSAIPGPKWPFFEFREERLKNGCANGTNE